MDLEINLLDPVAQTIQIFYTGKSPSKASDIVNTIASEFQTYDVEVKSQSAFKILKYIDEQLKSTFDTLNDMENRIENLKRDYGLDSLSIRPMAGLINKNDNIENQIDKIDIEIKYIDEFEKNLLENVDIDIFKMLAFSSGSEFKNSVSTLLGPLNNLLLQKENLKQDYTENSASVSAIDFQIDLQKKLIIENIKNLKKNFASQKTKLINKWENLKRNAYGGTKLSNEQLFQMFELRKIQRMYNLNEKYINDLIEKKAQYSLAKAGYISQNVILKSSKIPTIPISPDKQLAYIISLVLGTLISLALILIKYLMYNEITSINDISRYTEAPVLGIIPNYKKIIPVSQLIIDKKPKSMMAESLRAIRTNLQFISNEPGPKVIAVTSTISREGKTFFSINLAGIIAFSDKKVIIIDFDMRKPKIHVVFDSENTRGVSTILVGKDSPEDCITNTEFSNLDYITAGPTPPNPSELILNKRMDAMIQYLKTKYDFIIIDTPPVGVVTDGMKPIQIADYPIYILKANYSKRMFIQNILRLINENNIKKLSLSDI